MRNIKRLATILTTVSLLGWAAAGLEARTGKGDRFYSEGSQAEHAGDYEKALQAYEQALAEDPSDALYQMSVRRMRFQAAQVRVGVAQKLRNEGKLEEALAEFEKAYATDPASPIAEQELRRTLELIDREKKRATPLPPAERGITPAEEARRAADERLASVMGIPELKPISKQAIELTANNQPPARIIETVCKLAGINVIFDTDGTARLPTNAMSVAFKNVTLEEALNYIALQARVFWKPITANAIFVTVDTPQRRTEIEEQVTKVFYINNTGAAAQTDLNELRNMVTQMTGATRVAPSLSQNALIMRGTADQVQLAEMLIRNLDRAKAEVVVDVILLEANRTRSRDLSLNPVSGGANGLSIPITYSPRNPITTTGTGGTGTASTGAVRLSQVGKTDFGDYSVTLPGAILEAFMSDGGARILQSPQIRTVDGMKASLKIGEKVPYSSGGFQPTFGQVGGTGLNSLYNSFQFLDVGVNVDITPKVHGSDEVTLHIDLDVLAVKERIEIAGISQPVVGRRFISHDIRLKEGEVNILGGIVQTTESKTVSGVPGLASIPILKRLFTSESITKSESELMIAIVPRIIRAPDFDELNFKGIATGSERVIRLNYAPRRTEEAQAPQGAPGAAAAPAIVSPPATEASKPAAPAAPPAPASIVFNPAAAAAQPGGTLTLTLQVENVTDLFSAPIRLKFDPRVLRLTDATRGSFMAGDGRDVLFTRNISNDTGDLTVNLSRMPGTGGISGSGTLVTLNFQVVGQGLTTVTAPQLAFQDSQSQTVLSASPQVTVTVK